LSTRRVNRIWAIPIALGAASAIGLVAALLSERLGDVIGWAALGLPVAIVLRYSLRREGGG
jgi:hypothetical protein